MNPFATKTNALKIGLRKRLNLGFSISNENPLYFIHIPKTGGTTLSSYLNEQFSPEEIFPYQLWLHLYPTHPTQIDGYKLYRGHYGLSLLNHINAKPLLITALRDPVERTISQFHHMKSILNSGDDSWVPEDFLTKEATLLELLEDPIKSRFFTNTQARYLAVNYNPTLQQKESPYYSDIDPDFMALNVAESELQKRAEITLSNCVWVGITEKLDHSMMELQKIFGFRERQSLERRMIKPGRPAREDFDQKTVEKIRELTRVDQYLYERYL